jgi:hypothetical protein
MHVKRFADAKPYKAPNHRGVVGLRLQGFELGAILRHFLTSGQVESASFPNACSPDIFPTTR